MCTLENIPVGELICEVNNAKYLPSNGFSTDNKRFDTLFWTTRPSLCLTIFNRIRFLIAVLFAIILFLLASRSWYNFFFHYLTRLNRWGRFIM